MQYPKKMGECSDFKGSRRNRKKEEKRREGIIREKEMGLRIYKAVENSELWSWAMSTGHCRSDRCPYSIRLITGDKWNLVKEGWWITSPTRDSWIASVWPMPWLNLNNRLRFSFWKVQFGFESPLYGYRVWFMSCIPIHGWFSVRSLTNGSH